MCEQPILLFVLVACIVSAQHNPVSTVNSCFVRAALLSILFALIFYVPKFERAGNAQFVAL